MLVSIVGILAIFIIFIRPTRDGSVRQHANGIGDRPDDESDS